MDLEETRELGEKAIEWWENDKAALAQRESVDLLGIDHILPRLERLGMFLTRVVLPNMGSVSEDEWNEDSYAHLPRHGNTEYI